MKTIQHYIHPVEGMVMPRFSLTSGILCALLFGALWFANVAAAQQVQGGYRLNLDLNNDGVDSHWVHTFTAKQNADGTVTGQAHYSRMNGNTISFRSELRIDCMEFLDENTVILSGVTIQDTESEFVGSTFSFAARDNGEGSIIDQVTPVFYSIDLGFEIDCELVLFLIESGAVDLEALFNAIDKGNVQVQP